MNVGDIVTRVRNAAGDSQALQFTNSMINDWINDGIKECVVDNSLMQKSASTSTVIGTSEYSLPTDIFKLHSLIVDGELVEVLTLEEFNARFDSTSTETGRPRVAYVWAGKIVFWPTPSSVVTIKTNYTYEPLALAYDAGNENAWKALVPAIPSSYHNRLVTYCLAQVAFQDDDINKYNALMQEFKSGVKAVEHAQQSEEDLYPFISVSPRDSGNYFEYYEYFGEY